tara:strand:- start:115 stop:501 length:387 start_codon:yes stop_codon:yes gene_type:complete
MSKVENLKGKSNLLLVGGLRQQILGREGKYIVYHFQVTPTLLFHKPLNVPALAANLLVSMGILIVIIKKTEAVSNEVEILTTGTTHHHNTIQIRIFGELLSTASITNRAGVDDSKLLDIGLLGARNGV